MIKHLVQELCTEVQTGRQEGGKSLKQHPDRTDGDMVQDVTLKQRRAQREDGGQEVT